MLRLTPDPPEPRLVTFGGGAYARVRPATTVDYARARDRSAKLVAAVAESEEAARLFAIVAGLDIGARVEASDVASAAEAIATVFLAAECIVEIGGVAVGEGVLEAPVAVEHATLLCRDVAIAEALREAIFRRIAEEIDEGNGSPPSPAGGPGADGTTAETAGPAANPAPMAGPVGLESAAPSIATIH